MKKVFKIVAFVLLIALLILSITMLIRAIYVYAIQLNELQNQSDNNINYSDDYYKNFKKSLLTNMLSAIFHYGVDIVLLACTTYSIFCKEINELCLKLSKFGEKHKARKLKKLKIKIQKLEDDE